MIDYLRPYESYKQSGLPWLGKIPDHWNLLLNRALIRRRKILVGAKHSEHRLLSLTKRGVILRDVDSSKGKFSADMGTSQEVRAGDLVFCLFDIPETPRTVGLSRYDGMITGAYTVFECSDRRLAEFLDLFYRAMDDRKLLSPLYSGLRNTIPATRFLGTKTPVPPANEQVAIARYLAHAEKPIRRYIKAKQDLIMLLEEQRQAIIHRAVTHGLDPNVPLKCSGLPWLGSIPDHWELRRGKYYFREVDERSAHGTEELLSVSHKTGVTPRSEKNITMFMAESYVGHKTCQPGDIVVNTMWAYMGAVGVARKPGLVSPSYGVYRPIRQEYFLPDYIDLMLRTNIYVSEYNLRSRGITKSRIRLYPDDFLGIVFVCPPLSEQAALLIRVKKETSELQSAIDAANRQVALLNEFRTRLIADVATGELDVREAASNLPDEVAESEPLDELNDLSEDDLVVDEVEPEAVDEI